MAAQFEISEGMFTISVFKKSFRISHECGDVAPFIYTQTQISRYTARDYLKGMCKFWEDKQEPKEITPTDVINRFGGGSMSAAHLSELPYITPEGYAHTDVWDIVKTVLAQIKEYPTWEPDDVGEDAYNKQVMHMYCLLEEVFKQGQLAGKRDAANAVAKIILNSRGG